MTSTGSGSAKAGWSIWRLPGTGLAFRMQPSAPAALGVVLALMAAGVVLSVSYGEYAVSPIDVVRAAFGFETGDPNDELVVRSLRLPRVVTALMVGMALAASGTIMQGTTRNPLADPALLGINAGAGVAVVTYLFIADNPSNAVLPWLALVGALVAAALIYVLAWRSGVSANRLILIGVGIAAVGAAVINFLITQLAVEEAQGALRWLTGTVWGSTWADVRLLGAWLLVLIPTALILSRQLNPYLLGDSVAVGLGQRIELYRMLFVALAAALAAITVVVAGTIGFVGFVAPHIARRLVGLSHEGLLPVAIGVGALLMIVADLLSRWAVSPNGLPIGATTALLGAPYFAYLLMRTR